MRLILTLVVFVIAGPTLTGALVTALISAPELGYQAIDVQSNFALVVLAGFALSLPVSFIIAGQLMRRLAAPGNA